jgi:hypothetical protein
VLRKCDFAEIAFGAAASMLRIDLKGGYFSHAGPVFRKPGRNRQRLSAIHAAAKRFDGCRMACAGTGDAGSEAPESAAEMGMDHHFPEMPAAALISLNLLHRRNV